MAAQQGGSVSQSKQILFVCTGNTCRSPLAEVIFRRLVEAKGVDAALQAISAGTSAAAGAPAAAPARQVAREKGLTLEDHRSRSVSDQLVEQAHLILTMAAAHRDALRERYPERADAIMTLKEYARGGDPEQPNGAVPEDDSLDVDDPFGGDEDRYRAVADELTPLLERVLERWMKEHALQEENDS